MKKINSGKGDLILAAGNGLLDRRLFMKKGLVFSTYAAAATVVPEILAGEDSDSGIDSEIDTGRPPWMQTPGAPFSTYGMPSRFEADVVRFPSANSAVNGNGVSWTPLHLMEGMITPNGLHFERHHNGVPQIDPAYHKLLIHGMVRNPSFFRVDNLLRYPMQSRICFIECGGNSNAGWYKQPSRAEAGYFHGLVSCSEWTGVPLGTVLEEAGIDKNAKWLIAEGADAFAMNISVPLKEARKEGLLALYQNGERIRPENGYPLRLILPGLEGVLNVKWLRRLKATEQPVMARNETSKYTELLPSGKARMFTIHIDVKSLITAPSANMRLKSPGLYQITGLAWSGHGRIKKVEVTADGGKTWAVAELQKPVMSKAFTRFRIPWQWDGKPAVLKSRAFDEQGHIQPERKELVAQRGRHGFFHYNAIVTWQVDEDGVVNHIYDKDEVRQEGPVSIDTGWD